MIATESTPRSGWRREWTAPPSPEQPATEEGAAEPGLQRRILDFSAAHPAIWIAGAVTLGVLLGCIVKRR